MNQLAIIPGMKYSEGVRCGSLALVCNGEKPREFLGGACVDESVPGYSSLIPAPDSAHARAMPLLSVCGVFSWPKHFDPQSGLAVGCFVVVYHWGGAVAPRGGFDSRKRVMRGSTPRHHHKASLGPEWAALKKHRSSLDNLNLDELARRGPAWRVGQPNYGTKRKSVIFGAVGAYCGGANGPLKSPAFDVVVQVSGHRNSGTAGGSRNPCFGSNLSKGKAMKPKSDKGNAAFAESTTGLAFVLTLSKRQCNTLLRLREHEAMLGKPDTMGRTTKQACDPSGPANINIVQTDNLNPLKLRGLVSWHIDSKGKNNGFQGLTRAGELVADMLQEAGLSIENTNTLSVLKRLDRSAA